MADTEISKLPPLLEAELAAADVLAIVDVSLQETKKIRSDHLVAAAVNALPPGSIEGDAIDWDSATDGSIDGSKIANRSIQKEKLVLKALAVMN